MARTALSALGDLGPLKADSFLFISDEADPHAEKGGANSGDMVTAHAAVEAAFGLGEASLGLGTADLAPEELDVPGGPAAPASLGLGNAGAPSGIGFGVPEGVTTGAGITLIEPQFYGAKGGEKGPPSGGGGGGGGGGDGSASPEPNTLSSYLSGQDNGVPDSEEFNIEISFEGSWTEALQQHFIDMANYLSNVILDDIPDVFYRGKIIDDIRIEASLVEIDGPEGVLGRAGPTAVRTASWLPATAIMEFDIADAEYFDGLGLFDDIVLHEMLHCIGFGTMWDYMGLTSGSIEGGDLVFIGENAMAAYANEFGGSGGVPVETDFGSGTAGGHWDEFVFGTELMTGIIGDYYGGDPFATNYVSGVTIAALEDMGYDTGWDDLTDDTSNDAISGIPTAPINNTTDVIDDALIA